MPDSTDRAKQRTERLRMLRLQVSIERHLEDQGMEEPGVVAEATGVAPAEVERLLTAKQWRAGHLETLEAIARRLGLEIPPVDFDPVFSAQSVL